MEMLGVEVFVELEVKTKAGIMLSMDDDPGESKYFTMRGWIIKVGKDCTQDLKVGDYVMLHKTVDTTPGRNVSHSNVPKMVPNPNCQLYTFKETKEEIKTEPSCVLISEHQIIGVYG